MNAATGGIALLVLGLALAAFAAFGWGTLSKLPTHRVRSAIFGPGAARAMTIVAALLIAGVGLFLIVY